MKCKNTVWQTLVANSNIAENEEMIVAVNAIYAIA